MQMFTRRTNKINDVIISHPADDILQLYQSCGGWRFISAGTARDVCKEAGALQIERDEMQEKENPSFRGDQSLRRPAAAILFRATFISLRSLWKRRGKLMQDFFHFRHELSLPSLFPQR